MEPISNDKNDLELFDLRRLPASVRELVELLGVPETVKLLRTFGGANLYVPKRVSQRMRLLSSVSREAAEQLCAVFGGEVIELPKADHFTRQLRDREIVRHSAAGASRAELAAKFGLSRRQIGNIRRSYSIEDDSPFA
ncbi:MAG: Mor transcription activator family protein [Pseudomonadota bacterium]